MISLDNAGEGMGGGLRRSVCIQKKQLVDLVSRSLDWSYDQFSLKLSFYMDLQRYGLEGFIVHAVAEASFVPAKKYGAVPPPSEIRPRIGKGAVRRRGGGMTTYEAIAYHSRPPSDTGPVDSLGNRIPEYNWLCPHGRAVFCTICGFKSREQAERRKLPFTLEGVRAPVRLTGAKAKGTGSVDRGKGKRVYGCKRCALNPHSGPHQW
jgi:hypothetical protein